MKEETKMRIVFVCTGNTCRSLLAEGILERSLPDEWRDRVEITSAGVAAAGGQEISQFSLMVAAENGIDISRSRSRRMTTEVANEAALLIVMENSHKLPLLAAVDGGSEKTYLLRDFLPPGDPLSGEDIVDPFGGRLEDYREVFRQIRSALEKGWPLIEKRLTEEAVSTDKS